MNRNIPKFFANIEGAASAYRASIVNSLKVYRSNMNTAMQDAVRYKNEDEVIRESKATQKATALSAIAADEKKFTDVVRENIKSLHNELMQSLTQQPNATIIQNLRLVKDFNLQLSKTEIELFVEQIAGNLLSLRCLDATLEATNSPFRVKFTEVSQFESDLTRLETLAKGGLAYSPSELHHEACQIWDDLTSVELILRRQTFESRIKELSQMSQRWAESVKPTVIDKTDYEGEQDVAKQIVEDLQMKGAAELKAADRSEEYGRQNGQKRAAEDVRAEAALTAYRA